MNAGWQTVPDTRAGDGKWSAHNDLAMLLWCLLDLHFYRPAGLLTPNQLSQNTESKQHPRTVSKTHTCFKFCLTGLSQSLLVRLVPKSKLLLTVAVITTGCKLFLSPDKHCQRLEVSTYIYRHLYEHDQQRFTIRSIEINQSINKTTYSKWPVVTINIKIG